MPTLLGWSAFFGVLIIGLWAREDTSSQSWARAEVARRRAVQPANQVADESLALASDSEGVASVEHAE